MLLIILLYDYERKLHSQEGKIISGAIYTWGPSAFPREIAYFLKKLAQLPMESMPCATFASKFQWNCGKSAQAAHPRFGRVAGVSMNARAILRSENGGYIRSIFPEEQEYWEFLAEKGEVLKSVKQKHGRRITIYRMRTPKEPPVEPSSSSSSDCSLSENDSRAIAGLFEEPTRRQIERWLGWGLLTS